MHDATYAMAERSRDTRPFANAARSGVKFTLERASVINDSASMDKNGERKRQIRVGFMGSSICAYGIVDLRTCLDYAS